MSADLDRGAAARLIAERRRALLCQERERVAGANDPTTLIEKTRNGPFGGEHLAAVVNHMRVFEFDAIGGLPAVGKCGEKDRGEEKRRKCSQHLHKSNAALSQSPLIRL